MPSCELCGKQAVLVRADIEGIELEVCQQCGSFGKVTELKHAPIKKSTPLQELEPTEVIVSDFSLIIRNAREKLKLTQEEFAKKVNEKESIIHKIETGAFKPSIPLARRLEKILWIKLIEVGEEEILPQAKKTTGTVTIGDVIKRK